MEYPVQRQAKIARRREYRKGWMRDFRRRRRRQFGDGRGKNGKNQIRYKGGRFGPAIDDIREGT